MANISVDSILFLMLKVTLFENFNYLLMLFEYELSCFINLPVVPFTRQVGKQMNKMIERLHHN